MLNIIVLAAGLSRRMGAENKLLLPFQEKTILEVTLENLIQANLGEIVAVVGHEAERIKPLLKNYPLRIIENFNYEKGMTTSIQTGIRALSNTEMDFMICLSDMPLITSDEYSFLKKAFLEYKKEDEKAIVVPFFKGERGNPVVFSEFYKNVFLKLQNTALSESLREGGKSILKAYQNHVYKVEMPSDSILKDADTPEDYQRLLG